jgi:hypothetical protein
MIPAGLGPENDCAGEDSSNCKRQTRPLVREGVPYQQIRKCLTVLKNLVISPKIPRQTGRLTVGRNITVQFSTKIRVQSREWGYNGKQQFG